MSPIDRLASCIAFVVCTTAGYRTPATQIQLFIDTDAPQEPSIRIEVFSLNGSVLPNELANRANVGALRSPRLERLNSPMDSFIAGGSIGLLPPADCAVNQHRDALDSRDDRGHGIFASGVD